MKAPDFWQGKGFWPTLLAPIASLYGRISAHRASRPAAYNSRLPVICIGNLVAGGAGKTPTAIAIYHLLASAGCRPGFLLRGYGGREKGPLRVDPDKHNAGDVGDEPLMLSATGPVWIARERGGGARLMEGQGIDVILMDDGYQNPSLGKDFSLLVFDGESGISNGSVIPAGPLREPFEGGLERADAALIIGEDRTGLRARIGEQLPIFAGRIEAADPPTDGSYVAFCGIGRPEKFYETLLQGGANLVATRSFGDHHPYASEDIAALTKLAEQHQAQLITTEKDHVRLPSPFQDSVETLPVRLTIEGSDRLLDMIRTGISSKA